MLLKRYNEEVPDISQFFSKYLIFKLRYVTFIASSSDASKFVHYDQEEPIKFQLVA